jgi:protein PsiE
MVITLADLLLLFIYAEVFGLVAVYFRSHELPVIYPLFIAITALSRLIVLQGKDSAPEQLVFEAASILLISIAAILLRNVKVKIGTD